MSEDELYLAIDKLIIINRSLGAELKLAKANLIKLKVLQENAATAQSQGLTAKQVLAEAALTSAKATLKATELATNSALLTKEFADKVVAINASSPTL